jgi:hypothetical protein
MAVCVLFCRHKEFRRIGLSTLHATTVRRLYLALLGTYRAMQGC